MKNVGSSAVCESPKSLQVIRLAHSDARLEPQQVIATQSTFLNALRVGGQAYATQLQCSHKADKHIGCAQRKESLAARSPAWIFAQMCGRAGVPDKAAGDRETCEQSA